MMGTKVRSFAPLPEDLPLGVLVPEDHFYRRLHAALDLSLVKELVGPLYARARRPAVDPVVFFEAACKECPLKSRCTRSPKGRWASRDLEEEYLERVRGYRRTEAYRKAMRKRAAWVEPLLGEAMEWHGLGRFRLRRLEKVNAEALMIASGQNIKRLVSTTRADLWCRWPSCSPT